MNQEDKLRNTLREHYDNQDAAFNENDWDSASAYLSEYRAKGKRRRLVFFLLTSVLTSSLLIFNFIKPESFREQVASMTVKMTQEKVYSKRAVFSSSYVNKAKESATINLNPEKEKLSDTEKTPQIEKEYNTGKKTVAAEIKSERSKRTIERKPVAEVESASSETVKERNPLPVLFSEGSQSIDAEKAKEEKSNSEISGEEPNVSDITNESRTINNEAKSSALLVSQAESKSNENEKTENIPFLADDPNTKEIVLENLQEQSSNQKETLDATNHNPELAFKDTSSSSNLVFKDTLTPSYITQSDEGLFFEVGAAWNYGWKGAEKRDAQGFSPLFGINYMSRLGKKSSLSFGVDYLQVGNLSNASKTSRVSTYKYGEQSKVTVVTPTTLNYLTAPLRLHYFMNKKSILGVGVNLAYLLNVQSNVVTYDETPGSTQNYSKVKLSGYTQGFSWYDSQLAVFYRRKLYGPLALQVECFLGLTDIKQDVFFGFKAKERNSGLKLSLIYSAYKKSK